jgi:hypothetical protein
MNDTTLRYLDMGRRVTDFNDAHASSYPAGSRASELVGVIAAAVTALEAQGAKQDAADLDWQLATAQKKAALDTLVNLMRPINRMARGMEKLFPGIAARFRMPRGSDQNYINRAHAYITEATPMAAEFTNRGFPANFLTALEAAIAPVESAIEKQNDARAALTASTTALKTAQQQLIEAVREFSPIVSNTFAADAPTRAAWKSASHVERAPKKKAQSPPPSS